MEKKQMTAHSDLRREKARQLSKETGISVRQAYRKLRNVSVTEENENFDYEAETPKGAWV